MPPSELLEIEEFDSAQRAFRSAAMMKPFNPETGEGITTQAKADAAELKRLPAKERVVFCMRYLDDKPQQEIAAALSMSPGYVSKLLTRARGRLERRGWEVGRA